MESGDAISQSSKGLCKVRPVVMVQKTGNRDFNVAVTCNFITVVPLSREWLMLGLKLELMKLIDASPLHLPQRFFVRYLNAMFAIRANLEVSKYLLIHIFPQYTR